MENLTNGSEIPMGFGMALAQNLDAMNYFATLPVHEQGQIIEHTHSIGSKNEMQTYVNSLIDKDKFL